MARRVNVPEEHYILVANLVRSYDMKRLLAELVSSEDVPEAERRDVESKVSGWVERMQRRMGHFDK